ncbi:MAG: methyltransferase domain-containing protein, partial [Candidatus Eisenbacteria bacterium]|nr:methyltransferase domain-containing protein [Candidatus Eisenbacteria bacterium]
ADGSFDLVVNIDNIEHVVDAGAAVREMRRVLRPGGVYAVTTPCTWPGKDVSSYHIREYSREDFEALLVRGGMEPVRFLLETPYYFVLARRDDGWGEAFTRAGRCAAALVLAQLPYNLLVAALGFGAEALLGQGAQRGLAQKLVFLGVLGGTVVLQSLFLYVAALVVLERRGALQALRALPRTWSRGFWAALFLGTLLLVPLLPLQMLLDQAPRLVGRGDPDLVAWVVGLQALVGLLAWYVLAGSATLVYLSLVAGRAGEEAP